MSDLLFELFSEEIPARMQAGAAKDMLKSLEAKLKDAGLAYSGAEAFYGPRRLTFSVTGLPERQDDRTEERKGPKEGAPEQAVQGFLRGAGLDSLDQAELRETPKGNVWFAVTQIKGQETAAVLPAILLDVIQGYTWPKSQRWARTTFRWVRPLHRVLATFGSQVLDGTLDMGGGESLAFCNEAEGHRFLSDGTFVASSLSELETGLKDRHVLLRASDRKAAITEQLNAICASEGLSLIEDGGLLSEVAGLAEWPTVVMGSFDADYLKVPEECLILSMKEHQKYFAARKADGSLANVFFTISNMVANDGFEVIRAGNERVLNARLADARFFYEQDLATPLEKNLDKLKEIVFHAKLGSVADKVSRMRQLGAYLAELLGADAPKVDRAIQLMKADLVSGMVYEFPELQGVMGRYYALAAEEDAAVGDAIAQHYQPAGPNDACPTDLVSVIAALADKIDTLIGFWLINEKPTGSKDPYALRRAALGVIRIIRTNKLHLDLSLVLSAGARGYGDKLIKKSLNLNPGEPIRTDWKDQVIGSDGSPHVGLIRPLLELINFISQRLSITFKDQGYRHDHIDAVLGGMGENDLMRIEARLGATQSFLESERGSSLIGAYRRANNITSKASSWRRVSERPAEVSQDKHFSEALDDEAAAILFDLRYRQYEVVFERLFTLNSVIDAYFDAVMINADDTALRNQRLSLLADFVDAVNQVADLSKLEG